MLAGLGRVHARHKIGAPLPLPFRANRIRCERSLFSARSVREAQDDVRSDAVVRCVASGAYTPQCARHSASLPIVAARLSTKRATLSRRTLESRSPDETVFVATTAPDEMPRP